MTPRDLPETARPWTDKLGNVWCVVFPGDSETWVNVYLLLPEYPKWQMIETVRVYLVNADLLAGLGRTLPPVPSRKRVAQGATRLVPTCDRAQATRFADTDAVFTRLRRDFAIPFITSHRDGDLWYIGVPCPEMPAFWSGPWYVREEASDA